MSNIENIIEKQAKQQPDLFLVMSNEELQDALAVAESLLSNEEEKEIYLFMCQNYKTGEVYTLSCNGINVSEFIFEQEDKRYRFMFPMIPFYGLIPINDGEDYIALALSPTLNPDFTSIKGAIDLMEKKGFSVNKEFRREILESFDRPLKNEATYAKSHPVKSPWTIRDADTLKASLTVGGEASAISTVTDDIQITLYKNTNITLDICAAVNIMWCAAWDYRIIKNRTFSFPNTLVIKTNTSKTPVYIGPEVTIEEIKRILIENGLSTTLTEVEFPVEKDEIDAIIPEVFPSPRERAKETKMTM